MRKAPGFATTSPYEANEPDAYALEEALRQKEKNGGEVVVVTVGPARSQQVLREALAKGADRAIHLVDDSFVTIEPSAPPGQSRLPSKASRFDMIFTGLQSDDYGFAQTGVLLAEILGWPHATIIIGIEKTETGLRLKRELEAGQYQSIDMPLPCVLTIQSGINKLRYATLMGIKQARNKPLQQLTKAELEGKLGTNLQTIERLYVPTKQKKTEMLQGSTADIAKKLVDVLRNEARVI